jgi:hypothetical protein
MVVLAVESEGFSGKVEFARRVAESEDNVATVLPVGWRVNECIRERRKKMKAYQTW